MNILHVADGDHLNPSVGGSANRTREVARRLASRHRIVVLFPSYPGATRREEDGVQWIPVGPELGVRSGRLTFMALMALHIRRYDYDLVVEDFTAPFGVGMSSLVARRPVVGIVHWLFAREMREKYHVPFDWVEQAGLHRYQHLVAVSPWVGSILEARQPRTEVTVVPYGIDELAFQAPSLPPEHLAYIGRLDWFSKGLEDLLEIFAVVRDHFGESSPQLLIIGEGADRGHLNAKIHELHLERHVTLRGHVAGEDKYRLVGGAHAILMPSKFETFGMVAAEAQAAGVPVVAFDIPGLRDVGQSPGVTRVPPGARSEFARAVIEIVENPELQVERGRQARDWARSHLSWDEVAEREEAVYLGVAGKR